MDSLYENIGNKIMTAAKFIGAICIWGMLIGIFILFGTISIGICVIVSSIASFISSLFLYGFGHIIIKTDSIERQNRVSIELQKNQ